MAGLGNTTLINNQSIEHQLNSVSQPDYSVRNLKGNDSFHSRVSGNVRRSVNLS